MVTPMEFRGSFMTWNYAYNPHIWPSVFTAGLLILLAAYAWRRRRIPAALPFIIACLLAALWAAGSGMEYASVGLNTRIFWFKFQSIWFIPLVTAITCFILEYAWPGRWLTRRNLFLLSLPCFLSWGSVLTNGINHLTWRSFVFQGTFRPQFGLASWLFSIYAMGVLVALNVIVFGWLFLRSSLQRWPVILMLVGQFGGRTVFLLVKGNVIRTALPIDLLAMAFEFLMYAIALFGFQILDPIPLARLAAIEQLHSGILVLDPQGRIVSLNPAAEHILGETARKIKGRPLKDLLPAFASVSGDPLAGEAGQGEIRLGKGLEARYYQIEGSSLNDWRGMRIGRLFTLWDITEQKLAQTQIMEQQRALAALKEREQLARELHDSTSQVLAYASFQLEAIQNHLQNVEEAISAGNSAKANQRLVKAGDQLSRVSNIVEEAQADVREYILNLRLAPSDQRPFFATLRHYLNGFRQNYGLQVDLSLGPGIGEDTFDPGTQMQLFRIIQEALSNARKHAGASFVQVSFAAHDSRIQVQIRDDGCGFDLEQVQREQTPDQPAGHFGLASMGERAEQIGAGLQIHSAPGEGTCVEVEVPVNGEP